MLWWSLAIWRHLATSRRLTTSTIMLHWRHSGTSRWSSHLRLRARWRSTWWTLLRLGWWTPRTHHTMRPLLIGLSLQYMWRRQDLIDVHSRISQLSQIDEISMQGNMIRSTFIRFANVLEALYSLYYFTILVKYLLYMSRTGWWRHPASMLTWWRSTHHAFWATRWSTHYSHGRTSLHRRTSRSTHTHYRRHTSRPTTSWTHHSTRSRTSYNRLLLRRLHRIGRRRLRRLHHTSRRWLTSRLLLWRWLRRKDCSHFTGCSLLLPLGCFFLFFHNFGCF